MLTYDINKTRLPATKVARPKRLKSQVHWTCDFSRFGTATLVAESRVLATCYALKINYLRLNLIALGWGVIIRDLQEQNKTFVHFTTNI